MGTGSRGGDSSFCFVECSKIIKKKMLLNRLVWFVGGSTALTGLSWGANGAFQTLLEPIATDKLDVPNLPKTLSNFLDEEISKHPEINKSTVKITTLNDVFKSSFNYSPISFNYDYRVDLNRNTVRVPLSGLLYRLSLREEKREGSTIEDRGMCVGLKDKMIVDKFLIAREVESNKRSSLIHFAIPSSTVFAPVSIPLRVLLFGVATFGVIPAISRWQEKKTDLDTLQKFTKEEQEDIAKWNLFLDLTVARAPFFIEMIPKFIPLCEPSPLEKAKYIFNEAKAKA